MKMFGNPPIFHLVVVREECVIKDKSKEKKSKAAA